MYSHRKNGHLSWLKLFGLGFLAVAGIAAIYFSWLGWHLVSHPLFPSLAEIYVSNTKFDLPISVIAPTAVGVVTVFASVLVAVLTKRWERNRIIELENRRQKDPIYREFMAFWFKVLLSTAEGKEMTPQQITEGVAKYSQSLMIWGSDDAIKAYVQFRRTSTAAQKADYRAILRSFENILWAMRRDVGYKNKSLRGGDLLRMVLNDSDAVLGH